MANHIYVLKFLKLDIWCCAKPLTIHRRDCSAVESSVYLWQADSLQLLNQSEDPAPWVSARLYASIHNTSKLPPQFVSPDSTVKMCSVKQSRARVH